jgi:hypothetical protein
MEACVQLAWAVLRCEEASSSSGSTPTTISSSSTPTSTEAIARAGIAGAAGSAVVVAGSLAKQLSYPFVRTREFPKLADAAASNALYRLLLVKLALCCQAMQENSAVTASGQQVLPQQHHRLLLQELRVAWLEHSEMRKGNSAPLADIAAATVALRHNMNLAAAAALGNTRSSSSSDSNSNGSSSRSSILPPSSAPSAATATAAASSGGSSSCRFTNVEVAAMLTLLQIALLQAAGSGQWCREIAYIIEGFVMLLEDTAREAAAIVLLQPFLMQLLPASLTAAEAAAQAAPNTGSTVAPQQPASAEPATADGAAASPDTSHAESAVLSPSLSYYTRALHALLGTGSRKSQLHFRNSAAAPIFKPVTGSSGNHRV